MNSREKMLAAIAKNKPASVPLPDLASLESPEPDLLSKFSTVAVSVGSKVFEVADYAEIQSLLQKQFGSEKRIVSRVPELGPLAEEQDLQASDPHSLQDVDLAILKASLGVAENSAVWLSEKQLCQRVLPFICQHLSIIIRKERIVADMHDAYRKLESAAAYGYGVFIAGPSKTADIEQSLVLGAHGPRSLTLFILSEGEGKFVSNT